MKLPKIKTIRDIIRYLSRTPDDSWCTYIRTNGINQHCVLGHLEQIQLYHLEPFNLSPEVLAAVNNHGDANKHWASDEDQHFCDKSLDIKTRVLNYLKSLL